MPAVKAEELQDASLRHLLAQSTGPSSGQYMQANTHLRKNQGALRSTVGRGKMTKKIQLFFDFFAHSSIFLSYQNKYLKRSGEFFRSL